MEVQKEKTVYFWGVDSNHGHMSNFFVCPYKGKYGDVFCSEQDFMLMKLMQFDSNNEQLKNAMLSARLPDDVKKLGRLVRNFNQEVWDEVKSSCMIEAIYQKYDNNPDLKKKLLDTGNATLVEASPYDKIWGIGISEKDARSGVSWRGENLLGKALMFIRNAFRELEH